MPCVCSTAMTAASAPSSPDPRGGAGGASGGLGDSRTSGMLPGDDGASGGHRHGTKKHGGRSRGAKSTPSKSSPGKLLKSAGFSIMGAVAVNRVFGGDQDDGGGDELQVERSIVQREPDGGGRSDAESPNVARTPESLIC